MRFDWIFKDLFLLYSSRLLCFETPFTRSFTHPAALVGDVFRCLVPIFKNEEKTVITPLLSTGDQVKNITYIHIKMELCLTAIFDTVNLLFALISQ